MFGRKRKHEWCGMVKVEMDRETGLPLLKGGRRWEVARQSDVSALYDILPLEVRLVDRDGGIISSLPSTASEKDIRASAISVMGRVISRELDEGRIESLVGTYPPKVLR